MLRVEFLIPLYRSLVHIVPSSVIEDEVKVNDPFIDPTVQYVWISRFYLDEKNVVTILSWFSSSLCRLY